MAITPAWKHTPTNVNNIESNSLLSLQLDEGIGDCVHAKELGPFLNVVPADDTLIWLFGMAFLTYHMATATREGILIVVKESQANRAG